jgi:hypothetical protein
MKKGKKRNRMSNFHYGVKSADKQNDIKKSGKEHFMRQGTRVAFDLTVNILFCSLPWK